MRDLMQWFRGYLQIGLYGHQIHRFLNLCSGNGIRFWHVTNDVEHFLRVHVSLKDLYYLRPYFKKTHTRFRILRKVGFPFWCYRHPYLKWFPVLIMVLTCVFFYSKTYLWEIHIQGNDQITQNLVLEYLESHQISVGCKLERIDCSNLESDMRQTFSQIGWVSVSIHNNRLTIDMRESLYDILPEVPDDGLRYDFVADKDGIIHSMVTISGTAVVKEGDAVSKGDMLVKGICPLYDDYGEIIGVLQVKGDAYILADVDYYYEECINEIELMALKIAGTSYEDGAVWKSKQKLSYFLETLEENGVIILDKSVMIIKEENRIRYAAKIKGRELLGMNVPMEDWNN